MSHSTVVDVGMSSPEFQGQAPADVRYHGFVDLPTVKDHGVNSPEFACLGRLWRLVVYPGGAASSGDVMVGVYLRNESDEEIKIYFSFCVKYSNAWQ